MTPAGRAVREDATRDPNPSGFRGSRRLDVTLVAVLVAAVAGLSFVTWTLRERAIEAETQATDLHILTMLGQKISALEWEAIATDGLSAALEERSTAARATASQYSSRLVTTGEPELTRVDRLYRAYEAVLTQELSAIRGRDLEGARAIHTGEVGPAFEAFDGAAEDGGRLLQEVTTSRNAQATAATAVLLLLMGVVAVAGGGGSLRHRLHAVAEAARREADANRLRARQLELRWRAEREEAQRFDSLATSMSAGLVMTDETGRISFANDRYRALLGIPAQADRGWAFADLCAHVSAIAESPDQFEPAWTALRDATDAWESVEFSLAVPVPRALQCTAFPVRDAEQRRIGQGYLFIDVTRERETDRIKNEFISVASHELRTPLTGIVGFSELLATQLPEGPPRDWAARINTEAQRLTTIVDELLSVSQIESGSAEVRKEPVRLGTALFDAVQALALPEPEVARVDVTGDAADSVVRADHGKLVQVLVNLIDNALKYSPNGGPVRASLSRADTRFRIEVADTGVGIPAEELERVFDRFHRVDRTETRSIRGTGLGLYIVRQFVEQMGGTVRAESEVNRGSTFIVELPVDTDTDAAA